MNSCRPVTELLDAAVISVRDVDVAMGIQHNVVRVEELSRTCAKAAPLSDVLAATCEHLDAIVDQEGIATVLDYIDVTTGPSHDTPGPLELALPCAVATPLCDVLAVACEDLDTTVAGVCDVNVAAVINRDTVGEVELSRSRALAPPLGAVVGWQLTPGCAREQEEDHDGLNDDALPHGDLLTEIGHLTIESNVGALVHDGGCSHRATEPHLARADMEAIESESWCWFSSPVPPGTVSPRGHQGKGMSLRVFPEDMANCGSERARCWR